MCSSSSLDKDIPSAAELSKGNKLEKQNKLCGNFPLNQNVRFRIIIRIISEYISDIQYNINIIAEYIIRIIYCLVMKEPVTTLSYS